MGNYEHSHSLGPREMSDDDRAVEAESDRRIDEFLDAATNYRTPLPDIVDADWPIGL